MKKLSDNELNSFILSLIRLDNGLFRTSFSPSEAFVYSIGIKIITEEKPEELEQLLPPLSIFIKLISSILLFPTITKLLMQQILLVEIKSEAERIELKNLACLFISLLFR